MDNLKLFTAILLGGILAAQSTEIPKEPRVSIDCLPLGCEPGQVINTARISRINESLDSILTVNRLTDNKCAIGFGNDKGNALQNPKWYLHEGYIHTNPPPELSRGKTVLLLFLEDDWSLAETEGLISYDVADTKQKVVALWSVKPSGNKYNVKVYEKEVPLNKDLFNQMKDVAGSWTADYDPTTKVRSEYGIEVETHMTVDQKAKLVLVVNSKGYNATVGPYLHSWCDHRTFHGDRCAAECSPLGWCWTHTECKDNIECLDKVHQCDSGC